MVTIFVSEVTEYIQQIEAEIATLRVLRDQVRASIRSEEQPEPGEPRRSASRERAAGKNVGKSAGKSGAGNGKAYEVTFNKVVTRKRGRPKLQRA